MADTTNTQTNINPPSPENLSGPGIPGKDSEEAVISHEEQRFLQQVEAAEQLAERSPAQYKIKVLAWAMLGYLYMFIVPICLVAVLLLAIFLATRISIGLIATFKPIIVAVFIAFSCYIKALWVRFDAPDGHELKRAEFPQLFAFIDGLTQKTGVKVDHVMLTREMNAGVIQFPRYGFFGFYENYLQIGLSMMLVLNEKEFQAVLAHELGHLANQHSKRRAWVYSMRTRWNQILYALDSQSSFLLDFMIKFLNWYQPRFLTLTQVIARRQEREADLLAIEIAGADAHARSFLAMAAREALISNSAMSEIYRSYPIDPQPPENIYEKIAERISVEITDKEQILDALESLVTSKPEPFDTHPASSERILCSSRVKELDNLTVRKKAEKLIEIFDLTAALQKTAAKTIFGDSYGRALQIASQEWQSKVGEAWAARAEEMQAATKNKDTLNAKINNGELLTEAEVVKLAGAIEIIDGLEIALPHFQNIQEKYPGEPVSAFVIGTDLLSKNEEEKAFRYLELTARAGKAYRVDACKIILYFCEKNKDETKFAEFEKLLIDYYEEERRIAEERSAVSPTDPYHSHTASEEEVAKIIAPLKDHKEITAAYLIEKTVKLEKESRMFLLILKLAKDPGAFNTDSSYKKAQEICLKVANTAHFPGSGYIIFITGSKDGYWKIIEQHSNSLVFGNK